MRMTHVLVALYVFMPLEIFRRHFDIVDFTCSQRSRVMTSSFFQVAIRIGLWKSFVAASSA